MWRSVVVEQYISCVCVGVHMHVSLQLLSLLSRNNHDAISTNNIICVCNVHFQNVYSVWTSARVVECNYIYFVLSACHLGFDYKNLNYKCLTNKISTHYM